jgi:hypothetical protein
MTDDEFIEATFEAGSIAWETGAGMPPMPDDEDELTFLGVWWLGYMIARGRDYFRRREMALYPDTVEFRP